MNQEQILAEIQRALGGDTGPDDAFTTSEAVEHLAKVTGRSPMYLVKQVRVAISQLQAAGKLERVDVRRVSPVDGRNAKVKGYRMVA